MSYKNYFLKWYWRNLQEYAYDGRKIKSDRILVQRVFMVNETPIRRAQTFGLFSCFRENFILFCFSLFILFPTIIQMEILVCSCSKNRCHAMDWISQESCSTRGCCWTTIHCDMLFLEKVSRVCECCLIWKWKLLYLRGKSGVLNLLMKSRFC